MEDEYEYFCDESYYHLWAVRPKDSKAWGGCFHVRTEGEAKGLCELLNRRTQQLVALDEQEFKIYLIEAMADFATQQKIREFGSDLSDITTKHLDRIMAKFGTPQREVNENKIFDIIRNMDWFCKSKVATHEDAMSISKAIKDAIEKGTVYDN